MTVTIWQYRSPVTYVWTLWGITRYILFSAWGRNEHFCLRTQLPIFGCRSQWTFLPKYASALGCIIHCVLPWKAKCNSAWGRKWNMSARGRNVHKRGFGRRSHCAFGPGSNFLPHFCDHLFFNSCNSSNVYSTDKPLVHIHPPRSGWGLNAQPQTRLRQKARRRTPDPLHQRSVYPKCFYLVIYILLCACLRLPACCWRNTQCTLVFT